MVNGKFVTREDFLKDFDSGDCTVSEETFKTKEEFERQLAEEREAKEKEREEMTRKFQESLEMLQKLKKSHELIADEKAMKESELV